MTGRLRANSGHTAHRIWQRIVAELAACRISERTVRQYVQKRKLALGIVVHETFVPQSYQWGVEAQVDWYEAYADLSGHRTRLQVPSPPRVRFRLTCALRIKHLQNGDSAAWVSRCPRYPGGDPISLAIS